MLEVENIDLSYGAALALQGRVADRRAGAGDLRARAQRRGQDLADAGDLRAARRSAAGASSGRAQDIARLRPDARARLGVATVPQGREIFPLLTVRENLETGFALLPRARAHGPRHGLRAVPGARRDAGPARRRSLGRPAAAARDRPGDGDAPEAPADGRADRGHPALDHQGHRPGDRFLRDQGQMAIVLVEQYFDFAVALADRYAVMDRGRDRAGRRHRRDRRGGGAALDDGLNRNWRGVCD